MVTNRDRIPFGSRRKNSKTCSDDWHRWRFWSALRHFGTRSREMPSCSVIDLAEIWRSSKISSWIWSITSVLVRLGWGASQVEKLPHLNWIIQFLTVAYDGACSPNVSTRMAWISFGALPCRGEEKTWWQLASPCCWNCASRLACFLAASVTRKDLKFGTWTDPSFQRHYRFRPTTSGSRSG